MRDKLKIAVIGAGSAQFSMVLVRDLALTPGLNDCAVFFMDIDADRLGLIAKLAEKFVRETDARITFKFTLNRIEAIAGADFVINTALAGGHDQMEKERDAQEKNGYYRGIAVHAPYRQLKLMHDVAIDVEKYARPGVYLIQCSNPLPEGCTLMARETSINIIGLCHGHLPYRDLALALGVSPERVRFEATGINHCIWLTRFEIDGTDGYLRINEWIEKKSEEYWSTWTPHHEDKQMSPAAISLFRTYGLMPIGDTCRASWPEAWWYHVNQQAKIKWWGPDGGVDGEKGWLLHLKRMEDRLALIRTAAEDEKVSITSVFPAEKSNEQIAPIIDSIVNNREGIYQVNIPNKGSVRGLPDDFFVEVPAYIDGSGIRRKDIYPIPPKIMHGALFPRWLLAERIIGAYRTGDIGYILQVYLSDHRTLSREQAEKTICDVAQLKGNESMAAHFKSSMKDLLHV